MKASNKGWSFMMSSDYKEDNGADCISVGFG